MFISKEQLDGIMVALREDQGDIRALMAENKKLKERLDTLSDLIQHRHTVQVIDAARLNRQLVDNFAVVSSDMTLLKQHYDGLFELGNTLVDSMERLDSELSSVKDKVDIVAASHGMEFRHSTPVEEVIEVNITPGKDSQLVLVPTTAPKGFEDFVVDERNEELSLAEGLVVFQSSLGSSFSQYVDSGVARDVIEPEKRLEIKTKTKGKQKSKRGRK